MRQTTGFYLCVLNVIHVILGDLTTHPGHMKPFGSGGPFVQVPEVSEFPGPRDFFEMYVYKKVPLVVRGGAKQMAAFSKWTDDYLKGVEDTVTVEMTNDDRYNPHKEMMTLSDFINSYRNTNMYLISPIPHSLRPDVTVPCPLQCDQITKELMADHVIWISDGETKSSVHTDPAENINCILRGRKTFILVNSTKYRDFINMGTEPFDIDQVDYTKYGWMSEIEFYDIEVKAGDCLYIPYLWFHQVRSYGNTMAMNLWWKHYTGAGIDFDRCSVPCDRHRTITECNFIGIVELEQQPDEMRDFLLAMFDGRRHQSIDQTEFATMLDFGPLGGSFLKLLSLVDTDGDGYISEDDIKQIPTEKLQEVTNFLNPDSSKYGHDEF